MPNANESQRLYAQQGMSRVICHKGHSDTSLGMSIVGLCL